LKEEFHPKVFAKDLVELPKYHAFVKLMVNGIAAEPFSVSFPPPPKTPEKTGSEKIIKLSREKHTVYRKIIEQKRESTSFRNSKNSRAFRCSLFSLWKKYKSSFFTRRKNVNHA